MSKGKKKHSIKYRATSELIPYAMNSRTHSDEQVGQIAASINEYGFTNPILIDGDGETFEVLEDER